MTDPGSSRKLHCDRTIQRGVITAHGKKARWTMTEEQLCKGNTVFEELEKKRKQLTGITRYSHFYITYPTDDKEIIANVGYRDETLRSAVINTVRKQIKELEKQLEAI